MQSTRNDEQNFKEDIEKTRVQNEEVEVMVTRVEEREEGEFVPGASKGEMCPVM